MQSLTTEQICLIMYLSGVVASGYHGIRGLIKADKAGEMPINAGTICIVAIFTMMSWLTVLMAELARRERSNKLIRDLEKMIAEYEAANKDNKQETK